MACVRACPWMCIYIHTSIYIQRCDSVHRQIFSVSSYISRKRLHLEMSHLFYWAKNTYRRVGDTNKLGDVRVFQGSAIALTLNKTNGMNITTTTTSTTKTNKKKKKTKNKESSTRGYWEKEAAPQQLMRSSNIRRLLGDYRCRSLRSVRPSVRPSVRRIRRSLQSCKMKMKI